MKVLVICGDHPRHRFLLEPIKKYFKKITCIIMKRESSRKGFLSVTNNKKERHLLLSHFKLRYDKEIKFFGNKTAEDIFYKSNLIKINNKELNTKKVHKILENKFNICFVMGAGLFNKKTIKKLPRNTINIHLGLSPWYKGSATLFWPSYNLEPWKTGVTFHKIDESIDSGPILHQSVPKLKKNIGVIDLSILAIKEAQKDFDRILKAIKNKQKLIFVKQKNIGKTYYIKSFRACHLKIIYEFFNDRIVNYFLNNNKIRKVNLIKYI
jgi:folate-dependent phosphoribosylglycinamide formyltransferase PurN